MYTRIYTANGRPIQPTAANDKADVLNFSDSGAVMDDVRPLVSILFRCCKSRLPWIPISDGYSSSNETGVQCSSCYLNATVSCCDPPIWAICIVVHHAKCGKHSTLNTHACQYTKLEMQAKVFDKLCSLPLYFTLACRKRFSFDNLRQQPPDNCSSKTGKHISKHRVSHMQAIDLRI